MPNPLKPVVVTQADRDVAEAIDRMEWLYCDGRPNPALLALVAAHRQRAIEEVVAEYAQAVQVADYAIQRNREHDALKAAVEEMADALDQALDDMSGDGQCVCLAVKEEMQAALANYRKINGGGNGDAG